MIFSCTYTERTNPTNRPNKKTEKVIQLLGFLNNLPKKNDTNLSWRQNIHVFCRFISGCIHRLAATFSIPIENSESGQVFQCAAATFQK